MATKPATFLDVVGLALRGEEIDQTYEEILEVFDECIRVGVEIPDRLIEKANSLLNWRDFDGRTRYWERFENRVRYISRKTGRLLPKDSGDETP